MKVVKPSGCANEACDACFAHCFLVELLRQGQVWQALSPSLLLKAVEDCLEAYGKAGWLAKLPRKYHLPQGLTTHGFLPACWSTERKHKAVKKAANPLMNTSVFEKSLLEETLAEELFKTREPDLFQSGHAVLQPRDPPKAFAAFLQNEFGPNHFQRSASAKLSKGKVSTSDTVLLAVDGGRSFEAGEVLGIFSVNGRAYAWVSLLKLCSEDRATHSATWEPTGTSASSSWRLSWQQWCTPKVKASRLFCPFT